MLEYILSKRFASSILTIIVYDSDVQGGVLEYHASADSIEARSEVFIIFTQLVINDGDILTEHLT